MKIFLDTANLQAIQQLAPLGIIDGVTTNPSHLSKEQTDPKKLVLEICAALPNGLTSVEVTEKDPQAVYKQALVIAALAPNILVKIPCHKDYYPIINQLVKKQINLNITLVFSLVQGLMMAKLGVTYVSPFLGRLDDANGNGIELLYNLRLMIDQYHFNTSILASSIRTPDYVTAAIQAGADAITIPAQVLENSLEHQLTNQGIAKFDADWQKLGVKNFP